jgi:hypothetical protein
MSNSLFETKLAKVFSYNCIVESGHVLVLKPSSRVGFHEMDEVCSLHHLRELPACLSPLHLAIARRILFLPLLVPIHMILPLESQGHK